MLGASLPFPLAGRSGGIPGAGTRVDLQLRVDSRLFDTRYRNLRNMEDSTRFPSRSQASCHTIRSVTRSEHGVVSGCHLGPVFVPTSSFLKRRRSCRKSKIRGVSSDPGENDERVSTQRPSRAC